MTHFNTQNAQNSAQTGSHKNDNTSHGIALREEWLNNVAAEMMPYIGETAEDSVNGTDSDGQAGEAFRFPTVKVSCGWPHKGGTAKSRVRGECWDTAASEGNYAEIFISPMESDGREVAHILAHELVHALLGTAIGHKKPFPQIVKAMGLQGKPTATYADDDADFWTWAQPILDRAGDYPHATLTDTSGKKKSKTYLLKVVCAECDYTVRTTAKHADRALPACPCCSDYETGYIVPMELEE